MDRFSFVTHRSLGDNIGSSLKGMLFGLVLLVVAFPVLWKNEGRTDLSSLAKTATVARPDGSSPPASGKLVAVTDALKADAPLADSPYLKSSSWVRLDREPEMFAWVERVSTKTEKKLGGGTKETKTYTYEQAWTDSVQSSAGFRVPQGHTNPEPTIAEKHLAVDVAMIGVYGLDPSDAEMPSSTRLPLRPQMMERNAGLLADDALYVGRARPEHPRIGDERIRWSALPTGGVVTAYGKVAGHMLQPFVHEDDRLFRVVEGTHEEAIAQLHREHVMITWILRLVGFLCLWIGMSLLVAPVNAVLDIVPLVGSAGRVLTGIALLPIALGISMVIVFVSIVAHNPFVMIPLIALVTAGLWYAFKRAALKKAARTGRL